MKRACICGWNVIAGEDRSRVRHRNAVMNLAVIRRAAVSVAVHWIKRCRNPRQATLSGFYQFHVRQKLQNGLQTRNRLKTSQVVEFVIRPYLATDL